MLSQTIHSLLLLPELSLRALLHELLSLLPQIDKLNKLLPEVRLLEEEEQDGDQGLTYHQTFSSRIITTDVYY